MKAVELTIWCFRYVFLASGLLDMSSNVLDPDKLPLSYRAAAVCARSLRGRLIPLESHRTKGVRAINRDRMAT